MSLELLLWTRETTLAFHKNWKQTPPSKFMFLWMVSYYLFFLQINCVKTIRNTHFQWLTRIIIHYSKILLPSISFLIPNYSKRMFIIRRIIYIIFILFKKSFNRGLFSICFLRWYKKIIPKTYFFTFFVIIHCDECEQHRIPAFQLFAQYVSPVKSTHW